MDYLSTKEMSKIWNVSTARIVKLASSGRIKGAVLIGKSWLIPKDAVKPLDGRYKTQQKDKATVSNFHYPMYIFSNLSLQEAQQKLNPAELKLYTAEQLLDEGKMIEAEELLKQVLIEANDIYTKIGALFFKSQCSLFLFEVDEYFDDVNQIRKLFQTDFPYRKEMDFILIEVEGNVYGNKIYTEQFTIDQDYKYNEQSIPYMSVLSAYSSLIKCYTSHSKAAPEAFESVCFIMESQNNMKAAIAIHIYIALMYLINGNTEKKYIHLNKAFELAEEYKSISILTIFYPYIAKELLEYIDEHDCTILQNVKQMSENYIDSYSKLLKQNKRNAFYTKFDYEDYKYIRYARFGLTNKEISILENKSESFVNKRYIALCEKTGVISKADLYKAYANNVNSYEQ